MPVTTGTFGSALLVGGANPVLVAGNNSTFAAVVSINFCNQNSSTVRIRLAISQATNFSSITQDQWMEWNTLLQSNQPYERTARPLSPGDNVWAYSDTNNVSVQVYGVVARA